MDTVMHTPVQLQCFHCGRTCSTEKIVHQGKIFCCNGCRLAFQLISEKEMDAYYALNPTPGRTPADSRFQQTYAFLDDPALVQQLITFHDERTTHVRFNLPAIHCSSCIWLLENLYRLHPGIQMSTVDFTRKQAAIQYDAKHISLRELVELLTALGYEPEINLASVQQKVMKKTDYELYIKIGIAGFAFGNIMLLSLPGYLATGGRPPDQTFSTFFGILNILLSLPVLFFSATDYFKAAWQGIKQKRINIDVPISLGILALFLRSLDEIILNLQPGYMDSFSGLVFFLLLGKLFQKKTFDTLSFERDFRSYFPLTVTKLNGRQQQVTTIEKLKPSDRLLIRNQELIPADSRLLSSVALIDYSYVSGESVPVEKLKGDFIYAGGRHLGKSIEVEVLKEVSQSYLTQLWNAAEFKKPQMRELHSVADAISRYFTLAVLAVSVTAALIWLPVDPIRALIAFTSVLVIACPCALALAAPFTLGNTLRIFARSGLYLKNTAVIESMARTQVIVFDKTGTLTHASAAQVQFNACNGTALALSTEENSYIRSLVEHSTHPLSQMLLNHLIDYPATSLQNFQEIPGKGLSGKSAEVFIRLGSADYIGLPPELHPAEPSTLIFIEIGKRLRGYFKISAIYRPGLKQIIQSLRQLYSIYMLSGDTERLHPELDEFFPQKSMLYFRQTPFDKLNFIRDVQQKSRVLMVGDGLNDAGALQQSDTGVSITDEISAFTPASDAILEACAFKYLPQFLQYSKRSIQVIWTSFAISFLYNIIGLYFAVQGTLSPLIAAILMPASSISVVLFTIGMTNFLSKKMFAADRR
jgi:P-type Cu+ transporter